MKDSKQKILLILILFIIIITTSNYIYLKFVVHCFQLNLSQLSNILVFDFIIGGGTVVLLGKEMQFYIYDRSTEDNFSDSSKYLNNKYEKIFNCIDVGYAYYRIIKDGFGNPINAKVLEVNEAFAQILGETKENMLNYDFDILINKYMGERYEYLKIISKVQNEGKYKSADYISINEDKWIGLSIHKMKNGDFAIIITDVSERKKYLDEMKYLANYDSLTELKNRYSIYNYLAELKRRKKKFAILFIDLDNFKILNDDLGHDLGDSVLHKVALILRSHENDSIKIGRFGGDEFLIIIEDYTSTKKIEEFGQVIVDSLNLNYSYRSYSYNIKASVGVSVYNKDSDNIMTLIKYADIAMYNSKKQGGNMVSMFSGEMLENEIKRMC